MRFFLNIAFNGTPYHGWQRQPDAISVQQEIENALSTLLRTPITILGAGRTDTGVHAQQLYAHVDTQIDLTQDNWLYRINAFLPQAIALRSIAQVNANAHARFDASSRTYKYYVSTNKDPFSNAFCHTLKHKPDFELMNTAAKILLGTQDFKCFSRSNTDVKTYNCTITKAVWEFNGLQWVFTITADRFLRNMVRAVVGTLLDIGFKRKSLADLEHIIKSKDRTKAGASAPAKGLFLHKITYPDSIYKL